MSAGRSFAGAASRVHRGAVARAAGLAAGSKEIVLAGAIAAVLLGAAILPVTRSGGCEGELDRRAAALIVRLFDDGGSVLAVRERLRAEALEGSPAGRWDAPWDLGGAHAASCRPAPAPAVVDLAW
ncbi:MAG TPA: hypothetical protein VN033_09785 [Vulgatibacter sp.]|nr:hypothetical protein [Vulgatibacter sp.]